MNIKVFKYPSEYKVAVRVPRLNALVNTDFTHLYGEDHRCDTCGRFGRNTYELNALGGLFCVECKIEFEFANEQRLLGMTDKEFKSYRSRIQSNFNTDDGRNQRRFGIAFNE